MGIIIPALFVIGIIAFLCNAVPVIGEVAIVLIKYVIAPLLALFIICWLIKYGV